MKQRPSHPHPARSHRPLPCWTMANPPDRKAGHVPAKDSSEAHSRLILAKLVGFRDGDFSVRLPVGWGGTDGRIAEVFNQIATQEDRITKEVTRLSRVVGKEGRLRQRMSLPGAIGGWAAKVRFLEHAHRRSGATDDRSRAHHRRGGQGRSRAVDGAGGGRARAQGRVPALGKAGQHDDRAALGLHFGSDPRGARGRHRGQARRPGAGQGRVGRMEGSHRHREPDGRQPHRRRSATSPT